MATIHVDTEVEGNQRWSYEVRVAEGGREHAFRVTLSWSDYDLWSHGRVAPERVVDAIFRFLLEREPVTSVLSKFDCSLVRRYFPDVDKALPGMLSSRPAE